jgi:peptidyl-dipeptidase A
MRLTNKLSILLLSTCLLACNHRSSEVEQFLEDYNKRYSELYYEANKASWKTNTEIREGDTLNAYNSRVAEEALTAFTGSVENIESARKFLADTASLQPGQLRQLQAILYNAGSDPQTVAPLVREKITASIAQTEKLFGFPFQLDGKPVTTNDIDQILRDETNLDRRLRTWEASKEVGKVLKDGLVNLRRLRNETVQALDYPDFFAYQVSDDGTPE